MHISQEPQNFPENSTKPLVQDLETSPEPTNTQWIHIRLMEAFPDSMIHVQDTRGDDQHLCVTLSSTVFKGKTRIACHQMVYAALDHMRQGRIHAMGLKTIPV